MTALRCQLAESGDRMEKLTRVILSFTKLAAVFTVIAAVAAVVAIVRR